jgi:hypothetical protein
MSAPVIAATDLGTYLNDPSIDIDRAMALIADAQTLCESIVAPPLPAAAAVIVKRVAARAYVSIASPRQAQLAAAGSPYGAVGSMGGVYLTQYDVEDLRRLNGGGGAFSIDLLPAGYVAPTSWGRPGMGWF